MTGKKLYEASDYYFIDAYAEDLWQQLDSGVKKYGKEGKLDEPSKQTCCKKTEI